jgi:hypothetical protein
MEVNFATRKTLNKRNPKMVTNPRISLATNTTNIEILLQSNTKSDYQQLPVVFHSVFSWLPHAPLSTSCQLTSLTYYRCLYHIEPPRSLNSTLSGRLTLTFDLLSIHLHFDCHLIHLKWNFTTNNITTQHSCGLMVVHDFGRWNPLKFKL